MWARRSSPSSPTVPFPSAPWCSRAASCRIQAPNIEAVHVDPDGRRQFAARSTRCRGGLPRLAVLAAARRSPHAHRLRREGCRRAAPRATVGRRRRSEHVLCAHAALVRPGGSQRRCDAAWTSRACGRRISCRIFSSSRQSIAQQGVIAGPFRSTQVDVGRCARCRRRRGSGAARSDAQRPHLHGDRRGIAELSADRRAHEPHSRQAGALHGHHGERSARLAAGQRPVAGDDRSEAGVVGRVRVEPDQRRADAGRQGSDGPRAALGR